jgi:hypothetical protein
MIAIHARRFVPTVHVWLLVATSAVLFAAAREARAGDPSTGLISFPIRWCAMQGSPAVTNPALDGEMDTNTLLWHRHERASDLTWIPGANVTLRSDYIWQIKSTTGFPVIDDPKPPSVGGAGQLGDILDPGTDDTEMKDAVASCQSAWDALSQQVGMPLVGPVAVNINRFVDASGNPVSLKGRGSNKFNTSGANQAQVCANPSLVQSVDPNGTWVVVADQQYTRSVDANDSLLVAHEFGHTMFLGHGNGLDDDNNGVFDGYGSSGGCDPAEDVNATPFSIMSPSLNVDTHTVTSLQKNTVRPFAKAMPGVKIDPAGNWIDGTSVADARTDPPHDVPETQVDMTSAGFTTDTATAVTVFNWTIYSIIPTPHTNPMGNPLNTYAMYLDLDNNPNTGGAASSLNLPTTFSGAELVVVVDLSTTGGEFPQLVITPHVYVWSAGAWVESHDASIVGDVQTSRDLETLAPLHDTVSLSIADSAIPTIGPQVRFQATAQDLYQGGSLDRLPGTATTGTGDGVPLFPVPMTLPSCAADSAQLGTLANVQATGLKPSAMTKILLGDQMVGSGTTDANGNESANFAVPATTTTGPRLVTVGVAGTPATADCVIDIFGPAATSMPVPIDYHPTSCPNPFNVKSPGTFTVAIVGTGSFDVTRVDPSTVRFDGVPPLRSLIADVTAPFSPYIGKSRPTDCTTAGPDGIPDLVMQFDSTALARALGPVKKGQVLVLPLTGFLLPTFGGTPINGEDVIIIVTK